MEVKVRFRFNKITGEVEEFIVDDVDSRLPEPEHNREHERIATEIGRVIARNPGLEELKPSAIAKPKPVAERPGDQPIAENQRHGAAEVDRGEVERRGQKE
jgi:hypothetical protein